MQIIFHCSLILEGLLENLNATISSDPEQCLKGWDEISIFFPSLIFFYHKILHLYEYFAML